jgi:hypothetical protein
MVVGPGDDPETLPGTRDDVTRLTLALQPHFSRRQEFVPASRRRPIIRLKGLANDMSSDQAIGAPFTLASLSKPISSTNGHVHAAGVCSISGVKKRKRTEITVGIDGEGVSIYSVRIASLRQETAIHNLFSSKIPNW